MSSSKSIVGVDGSEHSIRALQWCAAHAAELDAEVVAVHVIDVLVHLGNSELPMLPLSAAQRDELHDHVTRDWCKPLAEAGVSISSRPDGWQGRRGALMRAAQIENADLVVTGRRGRGGLTELVLVP